MDRHQKRFTLFVIFALFLTAWTQPAQAGRQTYSFVVGVLDSLGITSGGVYTSPGFGDTLSTDATSDGSAATFENGSNTAKIIVTPVTPALRLSSDTPIQFSQTTTAGGSNDLRLQRDSADTETLQIFGKDFGGGSYGSANLAVDIISPVSSSTDLSFRDNAGTTQFTVSTSGIEMQSGAQVILDVSQDASAPDLAFASDTNTGLARSAATGDVRFISAGTVFGGWTATQFSTYIEGSAATPVLALSDPSGSDVSTGFYHAAANQIGITAGGNGIAYVSTNGMGALAPLAARTADDTATEARTGTIWTNSGASGTVTINLPTTPATGTTYTFVRVASQAFRIDPGSGAAIAYSAGGKMSDDEYLELGSDYARIKVVYDGADWLVTESAGTLTEETP